MAPYTVNVSTVPNHEHCENLMAHRKAQLLSLQPFKIALWFYKPSLGGICNRSLW